MMKTTIYACTHTYGNKKNNNGTFDFCTLYIDNKFIATNRENYHQEGKGLLLFEIPVSKDIYQKVMKLELPIQVELTTEGELVSGRLRTSIIDVKSVDKKE